MQKKTQEQHKGKQMNHEKTVTNEKNNKKNRITIFDGASAGGGSRSV